ncbi:immunoglobulin-like domain-containing protein [Allofustis seminis]|uniref:immunoglobulin-like domain-containing protein n=1 Tax=Allofustis seminis TaxID=166939 RepID=UPI00035D47C3|nr:immunoglobulin-like domain-containing protein [Allofustis seminis]
MKAEDAEDGPDLKDNVVIDAGNFDHTKVGTYEITFTLTDKDGATVTKKATVIVNPKAMVLNHTPTLEVADKTIIAGDELDLRTLIVKAEDAEDGPDLKDNVVIDAGNFDHTKVGTYKIIFTLKDKGGATVTKKATVIVAEKEPIDLNTGRNSNKKELTPREEDHQEGMILPKTGMHTKSVRYFGLFGALGVLLVVFNLRKKE